jgi:hypothetical protein
LEAQAAQSSQVERDLNDELDRLGSQVKELWNQNRSQPTTAGEGAQPTEQESNESHSSVSETRTKPSATGKKQKHPKSRKKHKR